VNSLPLVVRCVFYEDERIANLMKTNDNGVAMTRQKKRLEVAPGDGMDNASVGDWGCRERKCKIMQ